METTPDIRFIKLGRAGRFEMECIDGTDPCIRFGFDSNQHKESLNGDWASIYNYWYTVAGKTAGKSTEITNQVKAFYTLDESTIWITFYKRKLYWCRASHEVIELPDASRVRRALNGWSCRDAHGGVLFVDNLSGALTRVQGYRGTICRVDAASYLINRLNGKTLPEIAGAENSLRLLEQSLEPLIQKLGWKDFELLTDLIFTQAGWQRISSLGKTEKSIDLDLMSPVTGKRAFVQVKSQANLETFLNYKAEFEGMTQYDEMYFVVHSPKADLADYQEEPGVVLLTVGRLSKLVVSAGLTGWLIRKLS